MALNSNKPLRVALIGMSGAGKSYWTRRLAAKYPKMTMNARLARAYADPPRSPAPTNVAHSTLTTTDE